MNKYLIALPLLIALCSCHHDDDDEPEDNRAQRTVLIYMAAENNLASYATDDLDEMKTASLSLAENQNLIVYLDKANSDTPPYLARLKGGELVDTVFMEEGLAADPTVLERTLRYTKEHFPAKSYGLVLWGHASGWLVSSNDSISKPMSRAFGGSTGNNSSYGTGNYWMNIVPMVKALTNAMGTERLKFIFGDCCCFACMEVAYEMRNVTDYVIGSPAEIPDMGAPFDQTVKDMFLETNNFYEQIVNNYYDYYLRTYSEYGNRFYNQKIGDLKGYSVPLSAIKTSELDRLAHATAQLLSTISDKVASGDLDLESVTYYAMYGSYRYSYDMNHILKKNTSPEDYNTWRTAFDQAVPCHLYSKNWMTNSSRLMNEMLYFDAEASDCGAVSMFFPSNAYSKTSPNWNKAVQQYQWNNIIQWQQYGW